MKQGIIDRAKDSLRSLHRLKEKGHQVGTLKFKKHVNSIPLKQYRHTWWIVDENHVHIQGIREKKLRVRGIAQIPKKAEATSAMLIRKHGDFYLHITTYKCKELLSNTCLEQNKEQALREKSIGIDLGIKNQITLSGGIRINYSVPITKKMKRLQRELNRREYESKNWYKTKEKLGKEYNKAVNQKRDIKNKLIHKPTETFNIICLQNDSIKAWMKNYGSKVISTGLGGITSALKRKGQTPIVVSRFYPSTQKCSNCSEVNMIERSETVYACLKCGLVIDRDLNSARNIEKEGLKMLKNEVPMEEVTRRELTPADTSATTLTNELVKYLNNIPRVRAGIVEETGSPALIVAQKHMIFSRG
jgi:putative transposase